MAGLLFCSGCLFPLSGLSEGRVVRTDVGDFLLKFFPLFMLTSSSLKSPAIEPMA